MFPYFAKKMHTVRRTFFPNAQKIKQNQYYVFWTAYVIQANA